MTSSRVRVLVVDDEPLARRGVVARLARHADVELAGECATGRDAVGVIIEQPPDVVFLDVQMPGMDGFEVATRIRATDNGRELPIIFLT